METNNSDLQSRDVNHCQHTLRSLKLQSFRSEFLFFAMGVKHAHTHSRRSACKQCGDSSDCTVHKRPMQRFTNFTLFFRPKVRKFAWTDSREMSEVCPHQFQRPVFPIEKYVLRHVPRRALTGEKNPGTQQASEKQHVDCCSSTRRSINDQCAAFRRLFRFLLFFHACEQRYTRYVLSVLHRILSRQNACNQYRKLSPSVLISGVVPLDIHSTLFFKND